MQTANSPDAPEGESGSNWRTYSESITCPICDEKDFSVLQEAEYPENLSLDRMREIFKSSSDTKLLDQLVECSGCSLVYLNPRIRADIIIASYSDAEDPKFLTQNSMRIRTFHKNFKKWANSFGVQIDKSTNVLDIGCAGGAFPKAAHDLGFSVVGVEPSRFLSEFARTEYSLDIRGGVLAEQKIPASQFNVVTMWDVIEHLSDPVAELKEIRKILDDDGFLLVNYPEYDSWPRKLLGKSWPFFLSVHLYYFSPPTIRQLLQKSGYTVVSFRPYFQTLELGYILERAESMFSAFSYVRKLVRFLGLSRVPFTYYIGQTFVTARKMQSTTQ